MPRENKKGTLQRKALGMMQSVKAEMGHFAPELQVELLVEMADAYQPIDRKQQVALLHRAFDTSANISEGATRRAQQFKIVQRLSAADPDAVLALRNAVDPRVRGVVERQLLRQNIRMGKLDDAVQQLTQWDQAWHFPYFESVGLIHKLKPDQSVERQAVFSAAIAAFRHEDAESFYGVDTLDRLILGCYNDVPAAMVNDAIDTILERSKSKGESLQARVSSDRGTFTFGSIYAFDLFQLLLVLEKVNPAEAKALLRDNPDVAAQAQQYSRNGASTGTQDGESSLPVLVDRSTISVSPKGSTQIQNTNLRMAEQARLTDSVVATAAKDYKGALAAAQSLSNQRIGDESDLGTPRCDALLAIADSMMRSGNSSAAKEALRELVAATMDVPPIIQVNYLVNAAALSAQVGDSQTACQDLDLAMKAAAQLYQDDAFGDPANSAAKIYWPSTVAWKASSVVATRMDADYGIAQAATIPDPEIEAVVKMAVAAAIMGRPPGNSQITIQRGRANFVTDIEFPGGQLRRTRAEATAAGPDTRLPSMKRLLCLATFGALLLCAARGAEGEGGAAGKDAPTGKAAAAGKGKFGPRDVEIELRGESKLRGEFVGDLNFVLETSFGTLQIPCEEMVSAARRGAKRPACRPGSGRPAVKDSDSNTPALKRAAAGYTIQALKMKAHGTLQTAALTLRSKLGDLN